MVQDVNAMAPPFQQHPAGVLSNLLNKFFPYFFAYIVDKIDETMHHFVIVVVGLCCKEQKAFWQNWQGLK
jgi:hypothetical protein